MKFKIVAICFILFNVSLLTSAQSFHLGKSTHTIPEFHGAINSDSIKTVNLNSLISHNNRERLTFGKPTLFPQTASAVYSIQIAIYSREARIEITFQIYCFVGAILSSSFAMHMN